jgi:hypothetical protein
MQDWFTITQDEKKFLTRLFRDCMLALLGIYLLLWTADTSITLILTANDKTFGYCERESC